MKALTLIEKFNNTMGKITIPLTIVCCVGLITRVLVSFVFSI
jgi:hypothetical protein